jgi:hypothetical protein
MVLFLWGALSDKRMNLSFVYAAGTHQLSLSWVQVPLDSWPYFTVSYLRLPFLSPPMTHRVMVEVFDPASTWVTFITDNWSAIYQLLSYWPESTSANLSVFPLSCKMSFVVATTEVSLAIVWQWTLLSCDHLTIHYIGIAGCCLVMDKKIRGFSPLVNYTDRAIAAGQRS